MEKRSKAHYQDAHYQDGKKKAHYQDGKKI